MTDESYIQLALEIAKKGTGFVSPNPLVGCVIVKKERIIGAGFHEKFGEPHAEINAIKSSKENIEGATLYINLEPCSHFGKTPPCVNQIIEKKIQRVVVGTLDMNPIVSGRGIKKLKEAGIDVKVGVLEKECVELNKLFFKYITKGIPYVTLKAAQTLDGKISDKGGNSKWISSGPSRTYVHKLRAAYDAVLVGSRTVERDDPALTVRLSEGRNPKRIILDTDLSVNMKHKIFKYNNDKNLIVIAGKKSAGKKSKVKQILNCGAEIIFVKEEGKKMLNLKQVLKELGKKQITSVLVEGGSGIFSSFIKENLFDEIQLFISPKILGCGLSAFENIGIKNINKAYKVNFKDVERIGDDILLQISK